MAKSDVALFSFNRGIVSRLGLARLDIKRVAISAELCNNYIPRVLGSMSMRAGTQYLGSSKDNAKARSLPFIFSTDDKASIELTNYAMRVWVDDEVISRPSVTTTITNGTFTTDIASWTDDDEVGGASSWVAPGYMQLLGTGLAAARRIQTVTVAGANIGVEHGLRIEIIRGPVTLRVGSSAGEDDYIRQTALDTGSHSLALTPTGNFYIQLESRLGRVVWVNSITIESAGNMVLTTIWPEAALQAIRKSPSGDILFIACKGYKQQKIERRSARSWSVVEYLAEDGPFRTQNVGPGTMEPSVLSGNGTLTSSLPVFRSTHVGGLFSVTSAGQQVTATITDENQFTDPIKITGVGSDRTFQILIIDLSGTGTTLTLQRSFTEPGTWTDVTTYTTNDTVSTNDTFDNQVIFYRIGCKTGDYVSGTIFPELSSAVGSITGVARVTGFTSNLVVDIEVLRDFGGTEPSADWAEGKWSEFRGYPSSVAIYEGRMGWFGKDTSALSVSDDYYSYDADTEGDSGPIVRSIGSGPVDTIHWAMPLQRLLLGGQGAEHSCRSTSFDEPLTPTNFNIKKAGRQGSANVEAVEVDDTGVFVQRGGTRVFELTFNGERLDYAPSHLSALVPDIGKPGIVRMAVQRQPDTRIHCVRSDGTVAMVIFDKVENVTCWITVDTPGAGGFVEDVEVLPAEEGDNEDFVYYWVRRTIDGATVRYREKWAFEDDCLGDDVCKLADSFVEFTGPISFISGLDHLEGEQVVVWADGKDVGTDENGDLIYTVTGGSITLAEEAQIGGVVGLPYTAQFKSGKLGQLQTQTGVSMKDNKTIAQLGMIMADVHRFGVKHGPDFNNLDDLPSMEFSYEVGANEVRENYDEMAFPFPGTYTTDQRICLQSQAPRPATIIAVYAKVEHHP